MVLQMQMPPLFWVCCTGMLDLWFLHDLGVETLISAFFLSSVLYVIGKSQMAIILYIYNKNHNVLRYIKAA